MDSNQFRKSAKELVDYIADYCDNIEDRHVIPEIQPGYLRDLVPKVAPQEPEEWESVLADIERVIMPGVTNWHHPHFHSYYPTANSYAALCGDMLSTGIACVGFSWAASPACTELEVVVLDWLAQLLQLPQCFISSRTSGGVINSTASEVTVVAMYAARNKKIVEYQKEHPEESKYMIAAKLIGYCSDQAHSSVERAGLLTMLEMRKIKSDSEHQMRGEALSMAIEEDKKKGLIPFIVVATLGTTASCAFDQLTEIGPICESENIWMHIDAAYAGSAFICPEFRPWLNGVEYASSFNFNPHKWLQVTFDCSTVWFRDTEHLVNAFNVDPVYLKHDNEGKVPDFRHWHVALGRRFRSLKLWFVLRLYGWKKLQEIIRHHVNLAHKFEDLIKQDSRFEIVEKVKLGLVCFRLIGDNKLTSDLNEKIKKDARISLVPSQFSDNGKFFLRFAICFQHAKEEDIAFAYNVISELCSS